MTGLAQWSTALVLALLAAVGVGVARVLTDRHIRAIHGAPHWVDRNQQHAAAEQAVGRTRQWMFIALWIVASVFSGFATRELMLSYLVILFVTNHAMRGLIGRLYDVGLRGAGRPPYAGETESKVLMLGYASFFMIGFNQPGVWWVVGLALLIAAVHTDISGHRDLDLSHLIVDRPLANGDTQVTTRGETRLTQRLSNDELAAWTSFEIARHPDLAAAKLITTGQNLLWFLLAVFVAQRTGDARPLFAPAPIVLTLLTALMHQAGNSRRRLLERQADSIGVAAVTDQAVLGRAFEAVARTNVEPLLTNGRGADSWWDRMERIGHTPAHPKPRALTMTPALKMIGAVSSAMFVVASFLLPIAHAAGPEVEAAVVLGTGREPATTWGGGDLVTALGGLLREGEAPKVLPTASFDDPELTAQIQQLTARLRSCVSGGGQFIAVPGEDGRITLVSGC